MAQALNESDIFNVILGTAGHIDHGKSTLVKRLTGIDPDRLPDEKRREMTIDLGFAPFELEDGRKMGIIDVPGHERFIKNMVAGATSLDLVLLVVAADEGPNLQTREHVNIMSLLGLRKGIIVLTKIDRSDSDLRELVRDEVGEVVKGTFLAEAPVAEVSAVTGEGMEDLVRLIHETIRDLPRRETSGVFRMPVQRVFSAKGFGTIITGVPVSGRLKTGESLEILPGQKKGRVRGLQAYKCDVSEIRAGHSSAINLSDLRPEEVHRGMVATTPGYFKSVRFVEGRFHYRPDRAVALKNRTPVKLHAGTGECDGRIVLLDKKELSPGDDCYAQFQLDEPIVAAPGDLYIVRLQSPMYTIGGGKILDASDQKLRRLRADVVQTLTEKEESLSSEGSRFEIAMKGAGAHTLNMKDLSVLAKMPEKACSESLEKIGAKLVRFKSNRFMHRAAFEGVMDSLAILVEKYHQENPLRAGMEMPILRNRAQLEQPLLEQALATLRENGTLVLEHDKVRRSSFEIKISPEDRQAMQEVDKLFRETRFATPRRADLVEKLSYTKERLKKVLDLLIDNGTVLLLKDDVLLHRDSLDEAIELIRTTIREKGAIEAAQVRDLIGTTRKYVIPLLEYLDKIGITRRVENRRVLR